MAVARGGEDKFLASPDDDLCRPVRMGPRRRAHSHRSKSCARSAAFARLDNEETGCCLRTCEKQQSLVGMVGRKTKRRTTIDQHA